MCSHKFEMWSRLSSQTKEALRGLKGARRQRLFWLRAHTLGVAKVGITPAAMKSSLFSTLC